MAKTVTKPRKVIHGRIGIFAELPKSTVKELKRRCALTKPPTPQWKVLAQAMAQRVAENRALKSVIEIQSDIFFKKKRAAVRKLIKRSAKKGRQ